MNAKLRDFVRRRAQSCCEYCGLPEAHAPVVPLHIEHIIARKHNGPTRPSNLALACFHCNLHKGTDLVGIDWPTRKRTSLFNPRRHKWHRHFQWDGLLLVGKTSIGRTTVALLGMNDEEMIDVRRTLLDEGAFPW